MKATIELKTERDVRLFLWLNKNDIAIINYTISSSNNYNVDQMYGGDINIAENAINEAFSICYDDPIQLNSYSLIFKRKKERTLPLKEFNWLKKCHDVCYFTWVFIRLFGKENSFLFDASIPNDPNINTCTIYNHLDLPLYPVSHQERIQSIIDFFDRVDLHLINKIKIMESIKNKWYEHYHLKNLLPLNKKEKYKCKWLWDYVNKDKNNIIRGSKKRESFNVINNRTHEVIDVPITIHFHSPSFLSLFRPSGYNEMYLTLNCIYVFLYYRDQNFIPRVKKAWESSVFRKSNKTKKIKTKRKKEIQNVIIEKITSEDLKNPSSLKPISEHDEKRIKAKEIMRKITERRDSNSPDEDPDVIGAVNFPF
ncbi:hypothetical protein SOW02_12065 [Pectobacterium actinidiae]|uniref:hypothetical protein n=1 Tax=Pectobacterium actinidiae TaxID=1507808 RepID=UPI002A823A91|nr:hypothetical protein [Pectobacterium actinidiae]MDY4315665.1 hypothetical protein [Pectobacterium actinidiae]